MNEQQKALLAKARESLDVARYIDARGSHGFAASRAYYAMFYVVEALLLAAFGERFQKTGRVPAGFHRLLLDAAECRQLGDYEVSSEVSSGLAGQQIENAQRFIDLAQSMLDPTTGNTQ